jgi:hypothetical protein
MYSGTTLTNYSGRLLGAHQKIDRAARRCLKQAFPNSNFPTIHRILHFEGGNGPDAIKRKSPALDEPWHYIQPFDETDTVLLDLISEHYDLLVKALSKDDMVRASFEAAWLAHAMVDGLTPAHHYPYEEKLEQLRGGKGKDGRTTVKTKIVMPGDTTRQQLSNNWKMWGVKGLLTTHGTFEWGVATIILPMRFKKRVEVSEMEAEHIVEHGIAPWFRRLTQEVARLELYDNFYAHGWTNKLAKDIRRNLAPTIVRAVATAWSSATLEATKDKKS